MQQPIVLTGENLSFSNVSVDHVIKSIKKLKPKKSLGKDYILPNIYKHCADVLTKLLA